MRRLMLLLAVWMLAGQATAQGTELNFSSYVNRQHPIDKLIIAPMEEQYEAMVGGLSKVVVHADGTLVPGPRAQFDAIASGKADFTFALCSYAPDHFQRTLQFELPGLYTDPVEATNAMWDHIDYLGAEAPDIKLMVLWANDPTVLITREKPVTNLTDIRGLKIRVASQAHARIIRAWGGDPVMIPLPADTYTAFGAGEIDAIFIGASAINSFKFYDFGNFITTNLPSSVVAYYVAMNRARYDSLSEVEQRALDSFSGREASLRAAELYMNAGPRAIEISREKGLQIIELTPYQRQAFEDRFPYAKIEGGN